MFDMCPSLGLFCHICRSISLLNKSVLSHSYFHLFILILNISFAKISCNFIFNMTSHIDDDDYVYFGQDAVEASDEIEEVSDDCD